jgi:arylsulfatase
LTRGQLSPSARRRYLVIPAQAKVARFFGAFTDYPPAQRPASFSIDQIQERLRQQLNNAGGGQ